MWSTQYFTSLLNERQHFLFTVRYQTALRVLAFHLLLIIFLSFSYSVTLDPSLVILYFYTLRELNTYIKRPSPFFSSFSVVRQTQFFGIFKKHEKEMTRFIFLDLN